MVSIRHGVTIPGRLSEVVKELACLVRPLWRPEVSQEMLGDALEAGRQRKEQESYTWALRLEAQMLEKDRHARATTCRMEV